MKAKGREKYSEGSRRFDTAMNLIADFWYRPVVRFQINRGIKEKIVIHPKKAQGKICCSTI